MGSVDMASDHLDALVAGKRVAPRRPVALPVRIKGAHEEFVAEARDLSSGGALLLVTVEALTGDPEQGLDASGQFALVDRQFSQNFDIQFLSAPVVVEAQLVRLNLDTDVEGHVGLGCRFVHPLTGKQARALGLTSTSAEKQPGDDWDVSTGVHDVNRVARAKLPTGALLVDDHEERTGPIFLGRVVAAGRAAVVARLDGVDVQDAGDRLRTAGLRLRLLVGSEDLQELPVECVATRYVDAPRPGTEVLLALPERLKRGVWKRFQNA